MELVNRMALSRLAIFGVILILLFLWGWFAMIRMPGKSYRGPLPPLTPEESTLRNALRRDVEKLAGEIGIRHVFYYEQLARSADFLEMTLAEAGYEVHRQGFDVEGYTCENIEVERTGGTRRDEIVVIGGHYDSVFEGPGANDNATGVAAVLALARAFADKEIGRTVRFVCFVNEEQPYFQTPRMGSLVYASRCRERSEKVVAMLSLETIGYYSDEPGSQKYPPPLNLFYPSTGNFIGFVGNTKSKNLVHQVIGSFRRHTQFPSEGVATFASLPGISWSDQWAFWQAGYPGIMVTDTAPFRYPYYHTPADTSDKIDYDRLARVVAGLERVVAELVGVK